MLCIAIIQVISETAPQIISASTHTPIVIKVIGQTIGTAADISQAIGIKIAKNITAPEINKTTSNSLITHPINKSCFNFKVFRA